MGPSDSGLFGLYSDSGLRGPGLRLRAPGSGLRWLRLLWTARPRRPERTRSTDEEWGVRRFSRPGPDERVVNVLMPRRTAAF
ncbi:hypothetical protein GCM10017687_30630 [Streptomyces echinatus]